MFCLNDVMNNKFLVVLVQGGVGQWQDGLKVLQVVLLFCLYLYSFTYIWSLVFLIYFILFIYYSEGSGELFQMPYVTGKRGQCLEYQFHLSGCVCLCHVFFSCSNLLFSFLFSINKQGSPANPPTIYSFFIQILIFYYWLISLTYNYYYTLFIYLLCAIKIFTHSFYITFFATKTYIQQ